MSRRTFSMARPIRVRAQRAIERAEAGDAGDPNFASVVLLLDFAGADEATNITDLSAAGHNSETFVNTAKVDTADQYLGVNTLELGNTGYVSYADHDDWDFGTGDFTVELGIKMPAARSSRGILSNYSATEGFAFQTAENGSDDDLNVIMNGSNVKTETATLGSSSWYHIAISREGTNLRIFLNGVQQGTPTTNSTNMVSTKALTLGILSGPSLQAFTGRIGAVRITKGVARYTSNFTPPTEFYPLSA